MTAATLPGQARSPHEVRRPTVRVAGAGHIEPNGQEDR